MSVYVHRYIEINRKSLEGRVDFSNISKDLKPGCYYSGWEKGYHKYIKVISNENHNPVYEEVNEKDVPCRWELVKWYSDIRYGYSYEDDKSGTYKDDETSYSSTATYGQKNALEKARDYLEVSAFSYTGLIDQLEYVGYSHSEATYGADHCGADWKEQALKKANSYLDYSNFSYSGLVDQLEYVGFSNEEAVYAVDRCGADWYEQAVEKARSYLEFSSFSYSELVDQLEFVGFTYEQAAYGAKKAN